MTMDEAKRLKTLARWHRRLAVFVGLWLVVLAVTGTLINHAHDWGLDRSALPGSLQHMVYGVESGEDLCSAVADLGPDCRDLFGRLTMPAGELLLGVSRLVLLDGQGRVVESLSAAQFGLNGLEGGLRQGSQVYLRDARQTVRTDPELLDWEVVGADTAIAIEDGDWQERGTAATSITWERLLLDLHAARFMGPAAKYFNDLLAALILVLAFSGGWLYRSKRRRG
jgi:hypothetical protein